MDKIDFQTDILIVGGGPSGSTCARILANNDINTILLEKNFNFDKPCGGGVKEKVFKEFNIPISLITKNITLFNLISTKYKVPVDLTASPISIVKRNEFDHALRLLAQQDGANLIEGEFISSVSYHSHIISTVKIDSKIYTIKSNYVVGADGVNSKIKKAHFTNESKKVLTHYCISPNPSNIDYCNFYFDNRYAQGEYTWLFPHSNDISFGTAIKDKSVYKVFKNLKNENNITTKTKGYYIPKWNKEKLFYKNRIFLLGDAANQVLPFTYEGIYYVIQSAKILADSIIINDPESYEKNWNKKYYKRFNFFRRLQKIFLANDFMVHTMLKFFKNKTLQKKALGYWEGNLNPIPIHKIPYKLLKSLFISITK